jgi:streptogramin lyase
VTLALALSGSLAACEVDDEPDTQDPPLAGPSTQVERPGGHIAFGEGSVWVAHPFRGRVTRIDPRSGRVEGEPLETGTGALDVAVGDGAVWVAHPRDDSVSRIDPRSGEVTSIEVLEPVALAVGEGAVWVASEQLGHLTRIDPDSRRKTTLLTPLKPYRLAAGEGAVWILADSDSVVRVDPETGKAAGPTVQVPDAAQEISLAEGGVWVTSQGPAKEAQDTRGPGTVTRIDARSGTQLGDPIDIGKRPTQLAVGGGSVWIARGAEDAVTKVDVASGEQTHFRANEPVDVAIGGGTVWVTERPGTVKRIRP